MNDRERRIARARLLRRQGKTYNEIRAVMNIAVPDEELRAWLKGIPRPAATHRSHPEPAKRTRTRQMRLSGATYDEIAAELHVAKSTVHAWVSDLPVPERIRRRRADNARLLRS